MKAVLLLLVATIVVVQCKHLFLGTNVNRPMVHHLNFQKGGKLFQKRVEVFQYQLPNPTTIIYGQPPRAIQGILAVDMKGSQASANVTAGGIGYNFVNLRMKSERGSGLHYDIYIYG